MSTQNNKLAQHNNVRGIVYVLLSALCFSIAGVLIKVVDWNALSISAARSVFAVAVLYIYMRVCGRHLVINKAVLLGAFVNFIMMQTFVAANKLTTAANAIVLQFSEPIWVIILTCIIFHERPRREAIIACIVIFTGIICFFFDQLSSEGFIGNIVAIISGITYAGVFMIKRFPSCDFESAAIISFIACGICGIPTLVCETDFSITTLIVIAVLGVVQVGFAYIFLSKGLDLVSPITASLTSTIEPILNPILVALFLGETIGPASAVGAVLVIGGATAYNIYDSRH